MKRPLARAGARAAAVPDSIFTVRPGALVWRDSEGGRGEGGIRREEGLGGRERMRVRVGGGEGGKRGEEGGRRGGGEEEG